MNLVWFFDVCDERRAIFVPSKKKLIISLKKKIRIETTINI
jgi:hypothetical protein